MRRWCGNKPRAGVSVQSTSNEAQTLWSRTYWSQVKVFKNIRIWGRLPGAAHMHHDATASQTVSTLLCKLFRSIVDHY